MAGAFLYDDPTEVGSKLSGAPAPPRIGDAFSPGRDGLDFHVRLGPVPSARIRALAAEAGIPVTAAIRVLLQRALDLPDPESSGRRRGRQARESERRQRALILAGLLGTEQLVLLVTSFLPYGEEKAAKALEGAPAAVQRRLDDLEAVMASLGEEWP